MLFRSGHQVHQRGLAAAVGAHQAGDTGRDGQADLVDADRKDREIPGGELPRWRKLEVRFP